MNFALLGSKLRNLTACTQKTQFQSRFFHSSRISLNTMRATSSDEVIVEESGRFKKVILNRPKALNALNLNMVRALIPCYQDWINDSSNLVLMKGAGEKKFCAGGDVKAIWENGKSGNFGRGNLTSDFFYEEYQLNYLIARRKCVQVSFWDGVTMGGGVGLSVHGKYRIATENTVFAMPETGIGFFPDVGGTYFLSRLDLKQGCLGKYLGLTGTTLKGVDTVAAGVATHYVPSVKLPELESALQALGESGQVTIEAVGAILDKFAEKTDKYPADLIPVKNQIASCFGQSSLEAICQELQKLVDNGKESSQWAKGVLETLTRVSPTSLKVVNKQLTLGLSLSLEECFRMEYNLSQHFMKGNDFYEGIRAQLVDKDRKPKWNPTTLAEVEDAKVDAYFEPAAEEWTPAGEPGEVKAKL